VTPLRPENYAATPYEGRYDVRSSGEGPIAGCIRSGLGGKMEDHARCGIGVTDE